MVFLLLCDLRFFEKENQYNHIAVFYFWYMITTIAVAGAGTMGSGIAQVSAQSGHQIILFDCNKEILEKAIINIQKDLLPVLYKWIKLVKGSWAERPGKDFTIISVPIKS